MNKSTKIGTIIAIAVLLVLLNLAVRVIVLLLSFLPLWALAIVAATLAIGLATWIVSTFGGE